MTNILKSIMVNIDKLAKFLHLTKMRVSNQIFLIIAIMGIFMGIQVYFGVMIMSRLQHTTHIVYNETANKLYRLAELKTDLDQIPLAYLEGVTSSVKTQSEGFLEMATSTVQEIVDKVILKTEGLDGIDQSTKKRIIEQLKVIKNVTKETPGSQGYERIKESVISIKKDIDSSYSTVFSGALNVIIKNQRYADVSQRNSIIMVVLCLLISVFVGLVIMMALSKPLKTVEKATKSLATGDLSQNIYAEGSPEVMVAIMALNKAINGLRELVAGINQQSDTLFIASNELKEATNETRQSATQVAATTEELAKASFEQATQVANAVNSVELLSKLVTKVSTDTENIALASEHVAQTAVAGQKATNDMADEINKFYNSTKEVAKVINDLSETSGEISEITSVIHGIAEQTTLLALNASIEAARAGEHGKGFGVVANETGKLAEQSKQAASLIADLVNQMRIRTEQAVHVITDSTERAELGKNLASETMVTYREIFDTLKNILEEIDAVAKTAKQMAESNESVTNAITTIAAISEESSASTQEVSATTEEQSASVEQLSSLAKDLTQIAGSLKQSVAAFNLKSN